MDYIKIGVYGKRCLMCRFLSIGGKDKPCPQGGGLDVDPKPTEEFLHIWTKRTGGLDVEPKPTEVGEEGVSKCKF